MQQVRIRVGNGARDTETALLEDLDERIATVGRAPQPLLVIVPSRSLRHHLLATLARRHGAVLGLRCQTLHSLARTVVERGGQPVPLGGDLLFELFARRFARQERRLAEPLGGLRDGFAAVAATVRDLLDAGFDPAHAEALDEVLGTEGRQVATPEATERAQALMRIAQRTAVALDQHGSGGPSEVLVRAIDVLRAKGDDVQQMLPDAEIFIHGFADATGLATDLLQTLLERRGGTVYFDHPPDPALAGEAAPDDTSLLFGRRFRERLQALAEPDSTREPPPAPRIERFRALGESAEVREVAERIVLLLDDGARAETIAIVARDLGPYRTPLRIHLGRLGIPFFAAAQAGPPHPSTRRIEVLLELLEQGDGITLESWLDIFTGTFDGAALTDLRLAMAAGGWRRLRDLLLAGRPIDATRLRLPVFDRLGDNGRGETRPRRRRLDPIALERLQEIAAATRTRLRAWPREAPLADHVDAVERLLSQALVWEVSDPISRRVLEALDSLRRIATPELVSAAAEPGTLTVSREEFRLLLRRSLESGDQRGDTCLAGTRLGGLGAGIQILNAVEARGRTFAHLYLLGMNRGRFPRTVREDPILPDELRQVLGREGHGVLPDLGTKRGGHFEERFLFAQLLSASPRVTLSWLEVDDDDGRKSPSPLAERLRWSSGGQAQPAHDELPLARPIIATAAARDGGWRPRTAYEAAIVAGVSDRDQLGKLLPLALAEGWRENPPATLEPQSVAAARLAVLSEWDPPPGRGAQPLRVPGPYLGQIGRPLDEGDPRRANKLFVTTLENLARCPWQTHLSRLLGLEPLPDPLAGPPRLEASQIGSLVHRFLQSLIDDTAESEPRCTLEEFVVTGNAGTPPTTWPDPATLERRLRRFAERLLRREGIDYPGMTEVLTAAARRHLDVARLLDEREERVPLATAAEIYGAITLVGSDPPEKRLHFKADRADRFNEGLRLTDFKTGKPPSTLKTARSRHKALLSGVANGHLLQAAAYARAAADALASDPPASTSVASSGTDSTDAVAGGRYLHLSPDLDPDVLELPVEAGDVELFDLFDAVTATLLAQWEAGVLFPRL